eukprot:Clim_evm2s252 gene=Clim_evmTU2s252
MSSFYSNLRDLVSPARPLMAFYGLDIEGSDSRLFKLFLRPYSAENKTLTEDANMRSGQAPPLRYRICRNEETFPAPKYGQQTVRPRAPPGILKEDWIYKHQSIIPGLAVVFARLEWTDEDFDSRAEALGQKINHIRKAMQGAKRTNILDPAPLGESGGAQTNLDPLSQAQASRAGGSTDAIPQRDNAADAEPDQSVQRAPRVVVVLLQNERAISHEVVAKPAALLRKHAGLRERGELLYVPAVDECRDEELLGYVRRLQTSFINAAKEYYERRLADYEFLCDEAERLRQKDRNIRLLWKLGFYCEIIDNRERALDYYKTAMGRIYALINLEEASQPARGSQGSSVRNASVGQEPTAVNTSQPLLNRVVELKTVAMYFNYKICCLCAKESFEEARFAYETFIRRLNVNSLTVMEPFYVWHHLTWLALQHQLFAFIVQSSFAIEGTQMDVDTEDVSPEQGPVNRHIGYYFLEAASLTMQREEFWSANGIQLLAQIHQRNTGATTPGGKTAMDLLDLAARSETYGLVGTIPYYLTYPDATADRMSKDFVPSDRLVLELNRFLIPTTTHSGRTLRRLSSAPIDLDASGPQDERPYRSDAYVGVITSSKEEWKWILEQLTELGVESGGATYLSLPGPSASVVEEREKYLRLALVWLQSRTMHTDVAGTMLKRCLYFFEKFHCVRTLHRVELLEADIMLKDLSNPRRAATSSDHEIVYAKALKKYLHAARHLRQDARAARLCKLNAKLRTCSFYCVDMRSHLESLYCEAADPGLEATSRGEAQNAMATLLSGNVPPVPPALANVDPAVLRNIQLRWSSALQEFLTGMGLPHATRHDSTISNVSMDSMGPLSPPPILSASIDGDSLIASSLPQGGHVPAVLTIRLGGGQSKAPLTRHLPQGALADEISRGGLNSTISDITQQDHTDADLHYSLLEAKAGFGSPVIYEGDTARLDVTLMSRSTEPLIFDRVNVLFNMTAYDPQGVWKAASQDGGVIKLIPGEKIDHSFMLHIAPDHHVQAVAAQRTSASHKHRHGLSYQAQPEDPDVADIDLDTLYCEQVYVTLRGSSPTTDGLRLVLQLPLTGPVMRAGVVTRKPQITIGGAPYNFPMRKLQYLSHRETQKFNGDPRLVRETEEAFQKRFERDNGQVASTPIDLLDTETPPTLEARDGSTRDATIYGSSCLQVLRIEGLVDIALMGYQGNVQQVGDIVPASLSVASAGGNTLRITDARSSEGPLSLFAAVFNAITVSVTNRESFVIDGLEIELRAAPGRSGAGNTETVLFAAQPDFAEANLNHLSLSATRSLGKTRLKPGESVTATLFIHPGKNPRRLKVTTAVRYKLTSAMEQRGVGANIAHQQQQRTSKEMDRFVETIPVLQASSRLLNPSSMALLSCASGMSHGNVVSPMQMQQEQSQEALHSPEPFKMLARRVSSIVDSEAAILRPASSYLLHIDLVPRLGLAWAPTNSGNGSSIGGHVVTLHDLSLQIMSTLQPFVKRVAYVDSATGQHVPLTAKNSAEGGVELVFKPEGVVQLLRDAPFVLVFVIDTPPEFPSMAASTIGLELPDLGTLRLTWSMLPVGSPTTAADAAQHSNSLALHLPPVAVMPPSAVISPLYNALSFGPRRELISVHAKVPDLCKQREPLHIVYTLRNVSPEMCSITLVLQGAEGFVCSGLQRSTVSLAGYGSVTLELTTVPLVCGRTTPPYYDISAVPMGPVTVGADGFSEGPDFAVSIPEPLNPVLFIQPETTAEGS